MMMMRGENEDGPPEHVEVAGPRRRGDGVAVPDAVVLPRPLPPPNRQRGIRRGTYL